MADLRIRRLDAALRSHRPAYHATLDAVEARFDLALPPTLRALYRWRDGHGGTASLVDTHMWMPLSEVVEVKAMLDDLIGFDIAEGSWRRAWVPFLANGGGDYVCVDVVGNGGAPGRVFAYWHDGADRATENASVEAWLEALVASLENGTIEIT